MIIYKDDDHTYRNEYDELYTSVTTLIKQYTPKINWYEKAEAYVKKRTNAEIIKDLADKWSLTEKEIIAKFGTEYTADHIMYVWKEAGLRAVTGGSNWHDWKEIQDSRQANTILIPMYDGVKKFNAEDIKPNTIYLEAILRHHPSKTAGQADKIIIKETSSIVRDYKSVNKELIPEVKAYYNRKLRRNVAATFNRPIKHVKHSSYWEYAIQLSLYGYMLELLGYPPEALIIDQVLTEWIPVSEVTNQFVIHTDDTINKARVVTELKEIELPYLKKEVIDLLKFNTK